MTFLVFKIWTGCSECYCNAALSQMNVLPHGFKVLIDRKKQSFKAISPFQNVFCPDQKVKFVQMGSFSTKVSAHTEL